VKAPFENDSVVFIRELPIARVKKVQKSSKKAPQKPNEMAHFKNSL